MNELINMRLNNMFTYGTPSLLLIAFIGSPGIHFLILAAIVAGGR
ncbi:MAG: hypothetical protein ACYDH1_00210 [Anaerolineaceae bacterium]